MEQIDIWEESCDHCNDMENPCEHTNEKIYGGGE
jgi:hypothetical protein